MGSFPLPLPHAPSHQAMARHGLLRPWLERLITAEAVAAEALDADQESALLSQYCQRQGIDSEESLSAHLKLEQLSLEDLRWQLALPHRIQSFCQRQFAPRAEQRFLTRKTELDQVIYSLLRVRDPGMARELYLRISCGEAGFAELADRYTEGPERASQGIVGPVPLTQAHPVLAEKLRSCPVGKLMQPFAIEQWWLVVRPERLIPATFDSVMAERMARELFEAWVNEEVTRMLQAMADTAAPAGSTAP